VHQKNPYKAYVTFTVFAGSGNSGVSVLTQPFQACLGGLGEAESGRLEDGLPAAFLLAYDL
jgi:hypothetical protein